MNISREKTEKTGESSRRLPAAAGARQRRFKTLVAPSITVFFFFFPGTAFEKGFDGRFPVPSSQFPVLIWRFSVRGSRWWRSVPEQTWF
jgi:hypothetical protein